MGEFNEKTTCGTVCLKYLLFVFNCCFWLAGLAVMAVGIWTLALKSDYISLLASGTYLATAYILVVAGVVVMVTGVLGCCATFKERRNLLRLVSRAPGCWGRGRGGGALGPRGGRGGGGGGVGGRRTASAVLTGAGGGGHPCIPARPAAGSCPGVPAPAHCHEPSVATWDLRLGALLCRAWAPGVLTGRGRLRPTPADRPRSPRPPVLHPSPPHLSAGGHRWHPGLHLLPAAERRAQGTPEGHHDQAVPPARTRGCDQCGGQAAAGVPLLWQQQLP
uniref:CD151 molecule (Raph blood group) n=1 Tax=Panthera leo TaxID=9689 RepID=A0A8C8YBA6_PANLE